MSERPSAPFMDGWFAHLNKVGIGENPYVPLATQHYSHNQWVSGWCHRFEAVKHGKSLDLDDQLFR